MSRFGKEQYGIFSTGQGNTGHRMSISPPVFLERLVSRNIVREGDPLLLMVRVSGSPAPQVTWFHGERPITSSADFLLGHQEDVYTLHIREVFRDDSGTISAWAENGTGRIQCSTELVVKTPDESSSASIHDVISSMSYSTDRISSPPWAGGPAVSAVLPSSTVSSQNQIKHKLQFSKPLSDQMIREGQKMTMECSLPSSPPPDDVRWFRNGIEVRPTADCMISFRQGVCSLSIAEVFVEDSGNYVCQAFYNGASVSTSMSLQVKAAPTQQPISVESHAPTFDKPMTDLHQPLGSTAHFECHVMAVPAPEIVWSRRGRPMLDQTRYSSAYDQNTGYTSLTIREVREEDEGEYTCEAINSVGEAATSAKLQTTVQNISAHKTQQSSLSVTATSSSQQSSLSVTATSSSRRSTSVETHQTKKEKFDVSAFENKLLQDKSFMISGTGLNQMGFSHGSPSSAPLFVEKPERPEQKDGKEALFRCRVQGNPQPTMQWFHNGRPIRPSQHYKMFMNSAGECTLRVINHSPDDAGYYTFCVTNPAGREVCSVELDSENVLPEHAQSSAVGSEHAQSSAVWSEHAQSSAVWSQTAAVRSSQDNRGDELTERTRRSTSFQSPSTDLRMSENASSSEPVILEHLCDVKVEEGDQLTLSVSYAGMPPPQVTWHKDGRIIEATGQHYHVQNNDGVSTLSAESAQLSDSGFYVCTAVNVKGTARSQARLLVEGATKNLEEHQLHTRSVASRASEDRYVTSNLSDQIYRRSSLGVTSNVDIKQATSTSVSVETTSSFQTEMPSRGQIQSERNKSITPTLEKREQSGTCSTPRFNVHLKPITKVNRYEPVHFECDISPANDTDVKVDWFRDGERIMGGTNSSQSFSNGVAKLDIIRASEKDSGLYACKASNKYGSVSTQGRLQCIGKEGRTTSEQAFSTKNSDKTTTAQQSVVEQTKSTLQPSFIQPLPATVTARERQPISLEVTYRGNPEPTATWLRDDGQVESSNDFKVLTQTGRSSLHISDAIADKGGKYKVRIANVIGGAECSSEIKLAGDVSMAMKSHPEFKKVMRDTVRTIGSPVVFECEITGQPRPDVHWIKNGQRLTSSGQYRMTSSGNTYLLSIENISMQDSGVYECIASNLEGYATCRAQLSIKASNGDQTTNTAAAVAKDTDSPKFVMTLSDVRATAGSNATFEVTVRGQPAPEVTWYHRGRVLRTGQDYEIRQEDDRYRMIVRNCSRRISGIYSCRSVNKNGSAETSAELTVTGEIKETVSGAEPETMKPEFIRRLRDLSVKDGDETSLLCQVSGKPSPTISWYHNDENIDHSKDYIVAYNKDSGHIRLTITDCLPDDDGQFKCTATNSAGKAETSCVVTVTPGELKPTDVVGKPLGLAQKLTVKQKQTKVQKSAVSTSSSSVTQKHKGSPEDDSGSPRFTQPVQPFITYEGEGFVLEAVVVGKPEPAVVWLKGKEELPVMGGRHTVMFDRVTGTCSLIVRNALPSDAGVYSCQALSTTGRAISTANVVVVPVDAEVTITDRTKTVKKETVLHDGRQEMHIVETSPSVKQPLKAVTEVELGKSITLETLIEAKPQPTVVWFFNGVVLSESENIYFSQKRNKIQLIVRKCTREHVGEYTCRVSNKLGESVSSTNLRVIGVEESKVSKSTCDVQLHQELKQEAHKTTSTAITQTTVSKKKHSIAIEEPPRFVKPLSNQTGYDGKPMIFRVQYVGMPPISVLWFYNGQPVTSNGDFRVTHRPKVKRSPEEEDVMESCLTIAEVFPDDDGEYTCKAENSLGAAVTHCHFTVLREDDQQSTFTSEEQLNQVRHVLQKEPRRFSETIAIDNKPTMEEMSLQFELPQPRRERSEVSLRSSSIPRGQKMEVEINPPVTQSQQKVVSLKQRAEATATLRQEIMIPIIQQRSYSETSSFIKTTQKEIPSRDPRKKVSTSRITLTQASDDTTGTIVSQEEKERAQSCRYEMFLSKFLDTEEESRQKKEPIVGEGQPPKFSSLFKSQQVMDGEEVKFSTNVLGNPTPEITWFHDDKPISDNPDFKLKYDKETGLVELQIVEVFPQDTGVYNCVASNKYGRAVNTAQLTVEEYEYIADTEEAGFTSQAESSVSLSMDEGEFQVKTKSFLDNMSKLHDEDKKEIHSESILIEKSSTEKVETSPGQEKIRQRGVAAPGQTGNNFEETVLMADVKWQKSRQVAAHDEVVTVETSKLTEEAMRAEVSVSSVERKAVDLDSVRCVSRVVPVVECTPSQQLDIIDVSPVSAVTSVTSQGSLAEPVVLTIEPQKVSAESVTLTKAVTVQEQVVQKSDAGTTGEILKEPQMIATAQEVAPSEVIRKAEFSTSVEIIPARRIEIQLTPSVQNVERSDMQVNIQEQKSRISDEQSWESISDMPSVPSTEVGEEIVAVDSIELAELAERRRIVSRTELLKPGSSALVSETLFQDIETVTETSTVSEIQDGSTTQNESTVSVITSPTEAFLVAATQLVVHEPEKKEQNTVSELVDMKAEDMLSTAAELEEHVFTNRAEAIAMETNVQADISEIATEISCDVLEDLNQSASFKVEQQPELLEAISSRASQHSDDSSEDMYYDAMERTRDSTSVSDSSEHYEVTRTTDSEEGLMYSLSESTLVMSSPELANLSEAEGNSDEIDTQKVKRVDTKESSSVKVFSDEDLNWMDKQFEEAPSSPVIEELVTQADVRLVEGVVEPQSSPTFQMTLEDLTTSDGNKTILTCRLSGNPLPDVTWFVDGELVRPSADFIMELSDDGYCTLTILDTLPEDEGEYVVKAVNGLGESQTSAYLTVLPKVRQSSEVSQDISETSGSINVTEDVQLSTAATEINIPASEEKEAEVVQRLESVTVKETMVESEIKQQRQTSAAAVVEPLHEAAAVASVETAAVAAVETAVDSTRTTLTEQIQEETEQKSSAENVQLLEANIQVSTENAQKEDVQAQKTEQRVESVSQESTKEISNIVQESSTGTEIVTLEGKELSRSLRDDVQLSLPVEAEIENPMQLEECSETAKEQPTEEKPSEGIVDEYLEDYRTVQDIELLMNSREELNNEFTDENMEEMGIHSALEESVAVEEIKLSVEEYKAIQWIVSESHSVISVLDDLVYESVDDTSETVAAEETVQESEEELHTQLFEDVTTVLPSTNVKDCDVETPGEESLSEIDLLSSLEEKASEDTLEHSCATVEEIIKSMDQFVSLESEAEQIQTEEVDDIATLSTSEEISIESQTESGTEEPSIVTSSVSDYNCNEETTPDVSEEVGTEVEQLATEELPEGVEIECPMEAATNISSTASDYFANEDSMLDVSEEIGETLESQISENMPDGFEIENTLEDGSKVASVVESYQIKEETLSDIREGIEENVEPLSEEQLPEGIETENVMDSSSAISAQLCNYLSNEQTESVVSENIEEAPETISEDKLSDGLEIENIMSSTSDLSSATCDYLSKEQDTTEVGEEISETLEALSEESLPEGQEIECTLEEKISSASVNYLTLESMEKLSEESFEEKEDETASHPEVVEPVEVENSLSDNTVSTTHALPLVQEHLLADTIFDEFESIEELLQENSEVQVQETDVKNDQITMTDLNKDLKDCPISVLKPLSDGSAVEGENAVITCELSQPNLDVVWMMGDDVITTSDHFEMRREGTMYSLFIKSCTSRDAVTYKVLVDGTVKSSCSLDIMVIPRIEMDSNVAESGLVAKRGENVRHVLSYAANPSPTLTLQASSASLDSSRVSCRLIDNYKIEFEIKEIRADDEQIFTIELSNTVGKTSAALRVTVKGEPSVPRNLLVDNITESSCLLTYEKPEKDGGSTIQGYFIELSSDHGSTWTRINRDLIQDLSYQLTDISAGSEYSVRVTAVNEIGQSPASESSLFSTKSLGNVPGQPASPEVLQITGSDATLSWVAPESDGGSPISGYVVEWKKDMDEEWTVLRANSADMKSFLVSGLVEYTFYIFRVSAGNSVGYGEPSLPTKPVQYDKPGPPKDFQLKSVTDTSVTLMWSTPEFDGGSAVTSYLVETSAAGGDGWTVAGRLGCLELTVDSLVTGSTYSFRVAAENQCGLGEYSTLIDSVTLTPPEPARMRPWFIRKLPSRIEILENETFSFVCYTGESGCKPFFIKKLPTRMEAQRGIHFEAECVIGSRYDGAAVVSSRSAAALKRRSSSLGQRAKPTAPAGLRLTDLTPTSACIEWDSPADSGGAPVIHYILEKREAGQPEWEVLTNLPADINDCELENMVSNKGYYLRISAENKFGVSVPKELGEQIMVSLDDIPTPCRPENVQILRSEDQGLEVTWDAVESHPDAPVLQYLVEVREMRGPRWVRVSKVAVDSPPYILQNLSEDSDYEFRVFARNYVGLSDPSDTSKQFKGSSQAEDPARFVVELKNVMVDAGSKAEFECVVAGSPAPQVKWFKNMREIFDGYRHRMSQEEDCCRLLFHSVLQEDCGEVECRIFNSAGLAVSRAILSINAPAQLMLTPRFMHGLTFTSGQPMKMHVPILGSPEPEVTWSKDGEQINANERRHLVIEDGEAVLYVPQCCRREDAGQYTLRVRNPVGTDQAAFVVNITERPGAPQGKPVAKQISTDSCRLDWEAPSDDGGAAVTSYLVERREVTSSDVKSGEKGSETVEQSQEKISVGEGWQKVGSTHFTHMIAYKLTEGKRYEFRVRAENSEGLSDNSQLTDCLLMDPCSSEMNYDALVFPESTAVYKKVDVTKVKGEAELNSKYIICEELGRGAFGVIHRSIERATGKNCLAKFIACTPIERSMVRQEFGIMSELNHHCLQHLQEAYETTGEIAFILEFLSGSDLLTRITQSERSYTELDCIHWIREICQGVSHMHKNNIIHLDLRAENIYLLTSKSQDIKVLNFGIAQRVDPDRTVRVLFSTIEYCSPEVLTFAPVSFSSDMWSLGVLAFILLSGISPFCGKTVDETYLNITEGKGVSYSDPVWNNISHYAKNWIGRLVMKDSKKRMTVVEALSDPWLNGEAEAKISKANLPTEHHKSMIGKQKWRKSYKDVLPVGSLSHEGAVFLKLSQEGIAMERELFMELPDKAPEVVIELSNTEAYEGTVGRFKCKFHSQPEATVQWFHEEYALDSENPKYNIWYKHGLAMLNISDVDMEDCGQYSCVATNRLGSCTTVGELNIQEQAFKRSGYIPKRRRSVSFERDSSLSELRRSQSTERQASLDRSLGSSGCGASGSAAESFSSGYASYSTKVAPQFFLPLMDQVVVVGQPCTLTVLMSCKPDLEVSWFHGQTKLTSSSQYLMSSDNNNTFSLTIACVTAQDAGAWRCLGVNSFGQCMCVCKLQVLDEVPVDCEGPKFTQPLVKTIVVEGGPTRLECKVVGIPQPEVQWFKDRKLIGDDPFYMISCEEKEVHTLYIPATYSEHAGWYTCQARNVAGSLTTEAKLVVERMDCESMFSTHSSFDRTSLTDDMESVHTRTTTGSAQRKKKLLTSPPQFSARLRPKRCLEGQSIRFNCSVSGIPDPTISWQRANGTILLPSSRIKISNNYGLCSLEITRVRREDAGMYSVTASNTEGDVTSSASLDVEAQTTGLSGRAVKSQSFDMDWLKSASEDEDMCTLGLNLPLGKQSTVVESRDHQPELAKPQPPQASTDRESTDSGREPVSATGPAIRLSGSAPSQTPPVSLVTAPVPRDLMIPTCFQDIQWIDDSDYGATDGSDTEVPVSDDDLIKKLAPLDPGANPVTESSVGKTSKEIKSEPVKTESKQSSETLTQSSVEGTQSSVEATQSSVEGTQSSVEGTQSSVEATQSSVEATQLKEAEQDKGSAVAETSCSATDGAALTEVTDRDNRQTKIDPVSPEPIESTISREVNQAKTDRTVADCPAIDSNVAVSMDVISATESTNVTRISEAEGGLLNTEVANAELLTSERTEACSVSVEERSTLQLEQETGAEIRNIIEEIEKRAEEELSTKKLMISSIAAKVEESLAKEEESASTGEGETPVFREELKDVTVPLGDSATFSCVISSAKRCTVVWLKDGQFAKSRPNVQVSTDDCGRYTLIVSAVSEDDAGEYTVDAMNLFGSSSSSAKLRVMTSSDADGSSVGIKEESEGYSKMSERSGETLTSTVSQHTRQVSGEQPKQGEQQEQQKQGEQQEQQKQQEQRQMTRQRQQLQQQLLEQHKALQQEQEVSEELRKQLPQSRGLLPYEQGSPTGWGRVAQVLEHLPTHYISTISKTPSHTSVTSDINESQSLDSDCISNAASCDTNYELFCESDVSHQKQFKTISHTSVQSDRGTLEELTCNCVINRDSTVVVEEDCWTVQNIVSKSCSCCSEDRRVKSRSNSLSRVNRCRN